jgi:hypothetical protein
MRLQSLLLTSLVTLAGCVVPDLDLAGKKCEVDSDCAGAEQCTAGACVTPLTPCGPIPRLAPTQVVNGEANEFKGIPQRLLDSKHNGAVFVATSQEPPIGVKVAAQVAWSEEGLHLFFHVDDDSTGLVVPAKGEPLFDGDAIELFVKGDGDLTGKFNGRELDPGAMQIIFVPPAMGLPPRVESYANINSTKHAGFRDLGPLDPHDYDFKVSSTGFDLEVELPWHVIRGDDKVTPTAGDRIGFDFAIDHRSRTEEEFLYQLVLHDLEHGTGVGDCTQQDQHPPHPSCDDLTWCRPELAD